MLTIALFVYLGLFLYGLIARATNQLFHRFDPPENYTTVMGRMQHEDFIAVFTIAWPLYVVFYLPFFYLPKRIIWWLERRLDRMEVEHPDMTKNTAYRD